MVARVGDPAFWQGRKVLVTGACGFIGSHLVERLVALGAEVRAFVLYNSFGTWGWLDHSPVKDQIEVVMGDVTGAYNMREASEGIDTVFHLAALIAIPWSYTAPERYVDVNVMGTLNVLQAARHCGVRKVVHTSTSETYGTALQVPIDEDHPLQGQSPYSASKIGADKIAESFYLSFELPVATIRPFNTFGPRQSMRAVIPTTICQVLAGQTTIKLGSTEPKRDFNYVGDTVEGFILVGESEQAVGEVINVGSGREVSIGEMVQTVGKVLDTEIRIETDPQRIRPAASEVMRLLAGIAKAGKVLEYAPQVSFEDGIRQTAEFLRDNLHLYKTDRYVV